MAKPARHRRGDAPAAITIRLFGAFEGRRGEEPLPRTRTRKEVWLLSLLALRNGQAADRQWLAATLWPDSIDRQAAAYLRSSLYNLRQILGEEARRLEATNRIVRLDVLGASVDVLEFDRLIQQGDEKSLIDAVDRYGGPVVPDCGQEWALRERGSREQRYLEALGSLARAATARGDYAGAARWLRRACEADPLRESLHRELMEALESDGNLAQALVAFRDLRTMLHREVGVEPAPETVALFRRIKAGLPAPLPDGAFRSRLPPCRLPRTLDRLVGRDRELEAVRDLLTRRRLVTIYGPGGAGKTRLAIEAARRAAADYPHGVFFADLAPVHAGEMERVVAAALGVVERPGHDLWTSINRFAERRKLLLILDNCEHVRDGSAGLAARLLEVCEHLRVLVTTRQPLGVIGETVLSLQGLPLPMEERSRGRARPATSQADDLLESDAVRLFLERASQTDPQFRPNVSNRSAIAHICRSVDGLPLAIELAAARVRGLTVEQIADRIDEAPELLSRDTTSAVPRHRTLRAVVGWSYDLLPIHERSLFRHLAVFAGGWTLESAVEVCFEPGAPDRERLAADALAELIDRSLVVRDHSGEGDPRYRYLETVRGFALEKLLESGEEETLRRRHMETFLRVAETAAPHLYSSGFVEWSERLDAERENLRVAFQAACQIQPSSAVRIAAALGRFWLIRGSFMEGRRTLAAALALASNMSETEHAANALYWDGCLAARHGDYEDAWQRLRAARSIGDARGNKAESALALAGLGLTAWYRGRFSDARDLLEESLQLANQSGDRKAIATASGNLSLVCLETGDAGRAWTLQTKTLAMRREMGDRLGIANSLNDLGIMVFERGDCAGAERLLHESLDIRRELNDQWGLATALGNLGMVACDAGHGEEAVSLLRQSLSIRLEMDDLNGVAFCFENLAATEASAVTGGDATLAARLWGAAARLREDIQAMPNVFDQPRHRTRADELRRVLGDNAFELELARGRGLTLDRAAHLAFKSEPFATIE